jgi:bifunctional oligoribonuclease and PAP phosphatase NrnA
VSEQEDSGGALPVPAHRVGPLHEVRQRLLDASRVVLTTHLNADGDGTGSQVAMAAWLAERGIDATLINPTPYPAQFRFLLGQETRVSDWGSPGAGRALRAADLLLVLDTSEPRRIEPLAKEVPRERTLVIDHHPPGSETVSDVGLLDRTAAAVGELIYDFYRVGDDPIPEAALLGIYVALVTDTGSFRFSNTTPRTHRIAADLLAHGVDPEAVFERLYATVPLRRVQLLREALGTLEHDAEAGISWLLVPHVLIQRLGAEPDDLDGLVEHARSIQGTRVAMLFRETPEGTTKVSFRSSGAVDVNRIARRFGGGGHVKAAGATLPEPPQRAVPEVLEAARAALRES